jgi:hypothetical protein
MFKEESCQSFNSWRSIDKFTELFYMKFPSQTTYPGTKTGKFGQACQLESSLKQVPQGKDVILVDKRYDAGWDSSLKSFIDSSPTIVNLEISLRLAQFYGGGVVQENYCKSSRNAKF